MIKSKNVIITAALCLIFVLSGCSNLGDSIADTLSEIAPPANHEESEKEEKNDKDDKSDKDNDSSENEKNSLESLFGDLFKNDDPDGLQGLEGFNGLEDLFGSMNGNSGSGNPDQGNSGSGNFGSDSGNSGDYGDYSYDDMMNALNQIGGSNDEKLKDYYKFPKCTKWSEWPDADTWKAMGMIDIQPKGCDFAKVEDDGHIYLEGTWNGYYASCQCDDGEFVNITQQLWDAGYRGIPAGDGVVIEADSIDDIRKISEWSNTEFHAFYEQDGWVLCIEVEWHSWDHTIQVGIYDAKTMYNTYPDLQKYPSIDKSKASEGFPDQGLELIGTDFTGMWGEYNEGTESNPYMVEKYFMYSRNVTPDQWEAYRSKLDARTDIYCDGYGENGWDGIDIYYEKANSKGYTNAYVAYCEKAGLVYYGFYNDKY